MTADAMTRQQAHAVLDAARDGDDLPAWLIASALVVTGDLHPIRHAALWSQAINTRSSDAQTLKA